MRRTVFAVISVFALLSPLGCVMHKTSRATFCKELRRTPNLTQVFGGLGTDKPSKLRTKARHTAQQFTRLQRSAPRDIRSDVSQVANLADKIAQAIEEAPDNPQAVAAKLRLDASDMVGPTKAALRLSEYSTNTCHYDLNNLTGTSQPELSPTRDTTTLPVPPTTH